MDLIFRGLFKENVNGHQEPYTCHAKCVVVGIIGTMMSVLFALAAAHWRGSECSMFTVLQ